MLSCQLGQCGAGYTHMLLWKEPRPLFTVSSRELLISQALRDVKELISLLPRLCLQRCHLSADGSGWTPGFKKLRGCSLGGFLVRLRGPSRPFIPPTKRGPLLDKQQSGEIRFRQYKLCLLPLGFLLLVSISIGRPAGLHKHSLLSPRPPPSPPASDCGFVF